MVRLWGTRFILGLSALFPIELVYVPPCMLVLVDSHHGSLPSLLRPYCFAVLNLSFQRFAGQLGARHGRKEQVRLNLDVLVFLTSGKGEIRKVSTVVSATDLPSRVVVLVRNMEVITRPDLSCHAIVALCTGTPH